MKILMLVNWKIEKSKKRPEGKQPPDYVIEGKQYWFFRYFEELKIEVDVLDISSFAWLERIEKNKLHFYIWQALKAIPKLKCYDLVISHGMQSGVVISLWRRFFKSKAKHIVFDIGSFNSAAESGCALRLMQFSSKSIEYLIYHTGSQKEYYNRYFPWIAEKSEFIRFGTDLEFFRPEKIQKTKDRGTYILCVGYSKRDWDTLIEAYKLLHADIKLRLVGHIDERYASIPGVEQVAFIPINVLIEQIYNSLFGVLPLQSFNYSYGQMTLMQQMALEKCVIAAKVPSLIDYVENDVTAVLYEPQNSMELAAKMREILDNKEKREKIGKQGRKFLENKCNEKTMAKSIEQVIIKLMRNTD